ncbi:meiotic nuclear division protein 1 [Xylogone sp. PMI_703]|nr:meiotic nuclear division protein 1 [Xylogone sp. PMI_703]
MGVYSFKELEKLLPSVGSINGMQVKDYLQTLVDDNQIRVEKIGSGNWYWSFMSDVRKCKENTITSLMTEEMKLKSSIEELEIQIEQETSKRIDDDEMFEEDGMDRKTLLETHDVLLKEIEALGGELACYSDNDPTDVLRKLEEIERLKEVAMKWTDNIEAVQSFLLTLTDRDSVASIMQKTCGDEYTLGEGLKEL